MATGLTSDFGERQALWSTLRLRDGAWFQTAVFAFLALAIVAPKFLPVLLPALLLAFALRGHDVVAMLVPVRAKPVGAGALALASGALMMRGIFIAPDPREAAVVLLSFGAVATAGAALFCCTSALPQWETASMRSAIIAAIFATAAYLTFEFATKLAIISWVFAKLPLIAGSSKFTFIADEQGRELVRRHILNRSTGVLTLLLWPALLLTVIEVTRGSVRALSVPLLIAIASSAILLSAHETSKLALAISLVVFVLAHAAPRAAVTGLGALWIFANLAVVPAVRIAYDHGLQIDTSLSGSARARITIWNFTAQRIGPAWGLGKGIDSVRQDDMRTKPIYVRGEAGMQRTGRHSHNIYLQIWYEFGALGSVLFMLAGLALLRSIRRLDARLLPFGLATFAATMVMMGFSWGLWQHWYVAAMALSASVFALGASASQALASSGRVAISAPPALHLGARIRELVA